MVKTVMCRLILFAGQHRMITHMGSILGHIFFTRCTRNITISQMFHHTPQKLSH